MSKKPVKTNHGGYMSVDREEALKANWDKIQNMTLPNSDKVEEKSIDIPEMFRYMWTNDSTTMYHVHSPEFLRET